MNRGDTNLNEDMIVAVVIILHSRVKMNSANFHLHLCRGRGFESGWSPEIFCRLICNRPLALRGHVTNASFKQWVGILLMPKIDGAHENYLTPEIWEETHLREIFYGTLIFQQSSRICIGRHVGGHTLVVQHAWRPKLLFACILLNVW